MRKIWGVLLKAKLPASQAEVILINTFVRGWQDSVTESTESTVDTPELMRLLGLTCEEGLPLASLRAILAAKPPL